METLIEVPGNEIGLFGSGADLRIHNKPAKSKFTWLLDNGHGGIINGVYQTAGNRSPKLDNGEIVHEGVFTRIIVKKIIEKCQLNGISCIDLVDSELDIPLKSRVKIANEIHSQVKNCIYISLHANVFQAKESKEVQFVDRHGIETYYYQNPENPKQFDEKGRKLAALFQKNIIKNVKRRDRGIKGANYYVLRVTSMPSILTENGFMTHKEEAQLMLDMNYQDSIAQGHFESILEMEFLGAFK